MWVDLIWGGFSVTIEYQYWSFVECVSLLHFIPSVIINSHLTQKMKFVFRFSYSYYCTKRWFYEKFLISDVITLFKLHFNWVRYTWRIKEILKAVQENTLSSSVRNYLYIIPLDAPANYEEKDLMSSMEELAILASLRGFLWSQNYDKVATIKIQIYSSLNI